MKVGIDLQHNGKPGTPDLGAKGYFNDEETEYWWLSQYGLATQLELIKRGHTTFLNGMGSYQDRARRYNTLNCNLVVLCHVNMMPRGKAGQGKTGRIFLNYRTSSLNKKRAKKAADMMSRELPWDIKVQLANPDDWTRNAFSVQKGYKAWTWCFEPFFGDNKAHVDHIKSIGLMEFGRIIGASIDHAYG